MEVSYPFRLLETPLNVTPVVLIVDRVIRLLHAVLLLVSMQGRKYWERQADAISAWERITSAGTVTCYFCLKKSRNCRSNCNCKRCWGRHHISVCPVDAVNTYTGTRATTMTSPDQHSCIWTLNPLWLPVLISMMVVQGRNFMSS